jgi:hypothetical protein
MEIKIQTAVVGAHEGYKRESTRLGQTEHRKIAPQRLFCSSTTSMIQIRKTNSCVLLNSQSWHQITSGPVTFANLWTFIPVPEPKHLQFLPNGVPDW